MSEGQPYGGQQQPATDAAPGWYPTGDGWQRYWDGGQWTDHQAPIEAAASPGQYLGGPVSSNDTGIALLAHLGGAFLSFVVPLVIYIVKKDESPFLRHHSAEALNFQFTMFIASLVSFVLAFVVIGIFMLMALFVAFWVLTIIAAVAANRGEYYRYPATVRIFN